MWELWSLSANMATSGKSPRLLMHCIIGPSAFRCPLVVVSARFHRWQHCTGPAGSLGTGLKLFSTGSTFAWCLVGCMEERWCTLWCVHLRNVEGNGTRKGELQSFISKQARHGLPPELRKVWSLTRKLLSLWWPIRWPWVGCHLLAEHYHWYAQAHKGGMPSRLAQKWHYKKFQPPASASVWCHICALFFPDYTTTRRDERRKCPS